MTIRIKHNRRIALEQSIIHYLRLKPGLRCNNLTLGSDMDIHIEVVRSAPFSNKGYWVSFMTSLICKYTSNAIDARTKLWKSYECYCKYTEFAIIKILIATVSNSSRFVYVKQTFDV